MNKRQPVANVDPESLFEKPQKDGPGIDEPLAMLRNGQAYFFHADGLGSVVRITDATGTMVQSYEYVASSGGLDQPYGFTGRERDTETGLNYHRARYYEPEVGRWLSRDPIGFAGGDVNLYNYVQNNPINLTDPTGLNPFLNLIERVAPYLPALDKAGRFLADEFMNGSPGYFDLPEFLCQSHRSHRCRLTQTIRRSRITIHLLTTNVGLMICPMLAEGRLYELF